MLLFRSLPDMGIWKSSACMNSCFMIVSKRMMQKAVGWCCAWARQNARSVRVCLELFCSTFFFQEKKVENIEHEKSYNQSYSNASPGSAWQSTRDATVCKQNNNGKAIWVFEKVHQSTSRCRTRSGMTARVSTVCSQPDDKQFKQYGLLKKFATRA